jgi:hypothetical protein
VPGTPRAVARSGTDRIARMVLTLSLKLLLLAAPVILHEQAFRLERGGEAVAAFRASCERCDWGARGREGAVLVVSADGVEPRHLVLTRGTRGDYRVLLGALPAGQHRLAIAIDERYTAPAVGRVRVETVEIEAVAAGEPGHQALTHAPIVHTRKDSLRRFSDVPLMAWVETRPAPDAGREGRELRYSIVFSHEDGGTPLDRLMATWGRTTDIELVYQVELDRSGRVRRAEYQARNHVMKPFAGRREGGHPILYVVTKSNMLSDHGPSTPRVALAPVAFSLDGVSREAVMDAYPWTYHVSAQEVRREGRVRADARPGSGRIPDPRRFAYLEGCGSVSEARLAFDLAVPGEDGALEWHSSDGGRPDFRVARDGCFRAAVALPEGVSVHDVRALRLRAHSRPRRWSERASPRGTGAARVDRINRLFGLDGNDRPEASVFRWTEGASLEPDGPPVELRVRPD